MICLHVDVDNLWMYEQEYQINILNDRNYIYREALPRCLDLLKRTNSKATFMMIGRDLELPACQKFCRKAIRAGHEIANHSYSHPISFSTLSLAQKRAEIVKTHQLIKTVCRQAPVGFRSPGYYLDPEIIPMLKKFGYRYDSSVLPGYAQVLMTTYAKIKGGQIQHKSFGRTRDIFSSTKPYPILNTAKSVTELPISILPYLKLPIHTTFIYYFGESYRQLVLRYLRSKPEYVMYLMHAIDFVDLPIVTENHPVIPLRLTFNQRMTWIGEIVKALVAANGSPLETTQTQLRTSHH
ncbi:hypothetical protein A2W24_05600 [Microgenomates group bacterium RBG_16_45_19]|nr:MAG: hypothetical protein A2W24_05600 [Microgenomates group bacterium RBG_16_45_19]